MPNSPKVTRGSEEARAWARQRAAEMGLGVKRAREKAGLSAAKLEAKTRELGYPITRGTIAKIEGGHRDGKFDVNEVVALATALEVAPLDLIYPPTTEPVEYTPGNKVATGNALIYFANSAALAYASSRGHLQHHFDEKHEEFIALWAEVESQSNPAPDLAMQLEVVTVSLGLTAQDLIKNWQNLRDVGLAEGEDPRSADYKRAIQRMQEQRKKRETSRLDNG